MQKRKCKFPPKKIYHNYRYRVDFSRENHVRVSNFPPIFTAPVRKWFPAFFLSLPLYCAPHPEHSIIHAHAKCATLLRALCVYLFTNFRLRINHPILPCEWLSAFDISYCTPSEARRVSLLFFADMSFWCGKFGWLQPFEGSVVFYARWNDLSNFHITYSYYGYFIMGKVTFFQTVTFYLWQIS